MIALDESHNASQERCDPRPATKDTHPGDDEAAFGNSQVDASVAYWRAMRDEPLRLRATGARSGECPRE
jgi:hypothetical protein